MKSTLYKIFDNFYIENEIKIRGHSHMTSSPIEGEGVSPLMTIDNEWEGGLTNDDVIKNFERFIGFF